MPKTSVSMLKAIGKYQKERVDEIKIRVPKGRKEAIQALAEAAGQSVNGYVVQAIDEREARKDVKGGGDNA